MTVPATASPRTEKQALEYLQVRGYYSTPYTEIVQPERVFAISHYFRRYWLPLLKPGPAWLVVGLRQRCFWNQQQNWCVISREQLAAECGITARTLDKYLNLPLVSTWFLLKKVQRYRRTSDGRKQRDWTQYHVRLDDPLVPVHQAALTRLAREIQARSRAESPLAQAVETAEQILALDAQTLWQHLQAEPSHAAVTIPRTPQQILEAVCAVDPAAKLDAVDREDRLRLNRLSDALYARIVQPNKRQVASQYFRLRWMPILGAARAWLIMELRARCYWNEEDLIVRDTCTVSGGYQTLATRLGVSASTIKTCVNSPPGPTFMTRLGTRRPGRGQIEMDFRVEMIDPLTPQDQELYREKIVPDPDQKAEFAGSPPDQKAEFAGRSDQKAKFAGIWEPTKRQNLRNTKELLRTSQQKEDQQQQEQIAVAVVSSPNLNPDQANALTHLLQLGFQPFSAAQHYAAAYPPDQVVGWCKYAMKEGLGAGYVRSMLDAQESPPAIEESRMRILAKPDRPARNGPSWRKQIMQRYSITPEVMMVWDRALADLRLQMAGATFDSWLRGSLLLSVSGDPAQVATVGVKTTQAVEWLQNRLERVIRRTLARHLGVAEDRLELTFAVL